MNMSKYLFFKTIQVKLLSSTEKMRNRFMFSGTEQLKVLWVLRTSCCRRCKESKA